MFTPEYVQLCHQDARRWANKIPCLGDMYVDWERQTLDVIGVDTLGQIDFRFGRFTYLPSIDDLLELIDHQIQAWGDDPAKKTLHVTYDPEKKWCAQIGYAGRITFVSNQNSLEELLYKALKQMVYVDPSILDHPDKLHQIAISKEEPCHN